MKVTFREGIVYLSFKYSKVLIDFIKDNFIDRKYNPRTHEWYFPPYRQNVEILRKYSEKFGALPEDLEILPSFIISENGKGIYIRSRYDEKVVNLIKTLLPFKRVWKAESKTWFIHKNAFHMIACELIDYLDTLDDLYICAIDIDKYITEVDIKRFKDKDKLPFVLDPEKHKEMLKDLKKTFPFLRNYQVENVITYITKDNIFNCDEMGLGKTIDTGAYLKYTPFNSCIIVAPKAVLKQWQKELMKFFMLEVWIVPDEPKKRVELYHMIEEGLMKSESYCYILAVNYAKLLSKDFDDFISRNSFDILVLDEVTKIKDGRTKTHRAVKDIKAGKIIALTGTPVENRIQELYSLMNVIDYRFFGRFSNFAKDYLKKGEWGGYEATAEAPKKLGDKMKEFDGFIRWKKKEVLKELPEVIQNYYRFDLSKEERQKYNELISGTAEVYNMEGKKINLDNMLSLIQVLRLAVSDLSIYFDFDGSSKRTLFYELIEDYLNGKEENRKVVCFSQYKSVCNNYSEFLNVMGIKNILITGEHSTKIKDMLLERFKEGSESRVLICTDVFARAVNIQEASYLINIDIPWNPAVLQQRIGRLHRIGQKNPVNVINLIAEDTIEEVVVDRVLTKIRLFDDIIRVNEKSLISYIKDEIEKGRRILEAEEDTEVLKEFGKMTFMSLLDLKTMYPSMMISFDKKFPKRIALRNKKTGEIIAIEETCKLSGKKELERKKRLDYIIIYLRDKYDVIDLESSHRIDPHRYIKYKSLDEAYLDAVKEYVNKHPKDIVIRDECPSLTGIGNTIKLGKKLEEESKKNKYIRRKLEEESRKYRYLKKDEVDK